MEQILIRGYSKSNYLESVVTDGSVGLVSGMKFASDRDMFKKLVERGFHLIAVGEDEDYVEFTWETNRSSREYNYRICLQINDNDYRVFDGTQEAGCVDPTPIKRFHSEREMWESMDESGWSFLVSVEYPYDGWTRYIFVIEEREDEEDTDSEESEDFKLEVKRKVFFIFSRTYDIINKYVN